MGVKTLFGAYLAIIGVLAAFTWHVHERVDRWDIAIIVAGFVVCLGLLMPLMEMLAPPLDAPDREPEPVPDPR